MREHFIESTSQEVLKNKNEESFRYWAERNVDPNFVDELVAWAKDNIT